MGRKPCCGKGVIRGAWSAREDEILVNYIKAHGEGKWRELPRRAGLRRCGKSCRLRWLNYLRPDIKRGNISEDEEDLIIRLHKLLGNRWTLIAGRLPGRTDNEIKNYWNTILKKRIDGPNEKPKRSSKKPIKTTQNEELHHPSKHEVVCPTAVRCRNGKTFSQHQFRSTSSTPDSSSGFPMDSDINIGEYLVSVHHEEENNMDFDDNYRMLNDYDPGRTEIWSGAVGSFHENDDWDLEALASFLITEDV